MKPDNTIEKWPDMVRGLAKPGRDIVTGNLDAAVKTGSFRRVHILHMAVGIIGEVAEICEALHLPGTLEILDGQKPADGSPEYENLIEERGDIEFYIEGARQAVSLSPPAGFSIADELKHMDGLPLLVAASGRFLDLAKKLAIYMKDVRDGEFLDALDVTSAAVEEVFHTLGISREMAIEHNWEKLHKRYEGAIYSDERANERRDKKC